MRSRTPIHLIRRPKRLTGKLHTHHACSPATGRNTQISAQLVDNRADTVENLIHRAYAIHGGILALCRIVLGHDGRLLVVDAYTVADHALIGIIGPSAALSAQQDTLYQLLGRNIHIDHKIDFHALFLKNLI